MSMTNKERLETLRQDLIELFATCARDVRAVLYAPEIDSKRSQNPGLQNVNFALQGAVSAPSAPAFPYIRKFAKNIATSNSYAYALCRSDEALARDGQMLADGIIARWGKAQMLKVMPELIDDPDPEIQGDIANVLQRVEDVMASFAAEGKINPWGMGNSYRAFSGLRLAADETDKLTRMSIAGEILANIQAISVNTISGLAQSPAP